MTKGILVKAEGSVSKLHPLFFSCWLQKTEFLLVFDLSQLTSFVDAIIFPLIGGLALMFAKLSHGEAARWAEKQFFAVLLVITVVTLRTVITCHEIWLVHTSTLGVMIIGSLLIPGQATAPSQDTSVAV